MRISAVLISGLVALGAVYYPAPSVAQSVTNTVEGVAGDIDKKRRSPVLSVTAQHSGGAVKLLVDAYTPQKEYAKYPLQFDYYINRRFFTSQVRSVELPGAVGIDIGPNLATPPFNYTVVAKVLHPNRVFTTVMQGAVFSQNLVASLDCTFTQTTPTTDTVVVNSVSTTQSGNEQLGSSFVGYSVEDNEEFSITTALTTSGETVAGTLAVLQNGTPASYAVTGTASYDNGELTAVSVNDNSGVISLVCN